MGQRVDSRMDRVMVFPGAAWVTRVARVAVSERTEIDVGGLPAALDDDTVQIAVHGAARAADVRTTVEVIGAGDAGVVDDGELHERRRALAGAQAELAHLRRQLDGLTAFGAFGRSDRDEPAPAWADAVGARIALIELRAAREPVLRAAIAAAERAADDVRRALSAAELRRAQASSAQLPPGSVRKVLVITIEPEAREGGAGEIDIIISYLVPGASWAPSYVVRLGDDGELWLELRASIAQATGEDWSAVAVEVSTASPQRWVELPELPSLRLGRAQPTPARAGWRAPPADIDSLFADWDRAFAGRRGALPAAEPAPYDVTVETTGVYAAQDLDEDTKPYAYDDLAAGEERAAGWASDAPPPQAQRGPAGARRAAPPPPAPPMFASMSVSMPAPMAAPARKSASIVGNMVGGIGAGLGAIASGGAAVAKSVSGRARHAPGRGGAGDRLDLLAEHDADDENVEHVVELELLQYARLQMSGPHSSTRGKLTRLDRAAAWHADARAVRAIRAATERARAAASVPPPSGFAIAAAGNYDYAFAAEARVDVPADGGWHNVALLARAGKAAVRHVVVPAVAADVFRVASFTNPLDAPLLAGPIDVYDRGELAVTATLDETAPGASVELGLGVDASVKVARNARYREEAAGMLRGKLELHHEVTITAENLGTRAVALEVRERLPRPAPDEEDVEVHLDRVSPAWEPWRPDDSTLEGGHRWHLDLAPAAKRDLHLAYHIRIAGKHELVGGNRREP